MPDWLGGLASLLILAGAAQIAMVELLGAGAPWAVVVGTALIVNLRFVMYSGALAGAFAQFPPASRVPLAYLMTDQAAVTALLHHETQGDARARLWHYLGAGAFFAAPVDVVDDPAERLVDRHRVEELLAHLEVELREAMDVTAADIDRLATRELSPGRRLWLFALAGVGLIQGVLLTTVVATEPTPLPVETAVALLVIAAAS